MTIKHAWNAWDGWFHTGNNLFVDMIFARRAMMMMMFATKCMGNSNEVR
jgi:hypothetical protein